ncbi:MAG: hypothetical protein KatS3mg132_266 [Limisphaera sp.]|nr:MAG: hypothetical protein KatS3mg132_266 [Limisphaera sp.]
MIDQRNNVRDCRRLIELGPAISETSAESAWDKSLWPGHMSALHLGWARRPLPARRGAGYMALALGSESSRALRLDHAKPEIVATRFYEIPALTVQRVAPSEGEGCS